MKFFHANLYTNVFFLYTDNLPFYPFINVFQRGEMKKRNLLKLFVRTKNLLTSCKTNKI